MFLGINTSPELILSGRLEPVLERAGLSRIVIEVTEQATATDHVSLASASKP